MLQAEHHCLTAEALRESRVCGSLRHDRKNSRTEEFLSLQAKEPVQTVRLISHNIGSAYNGMFVSPPPSDSEDVVNRW